MRFFCLTLIAFCLSGCAASDPQFADQEPALTIEDNGVRGNLNLEIREYQGGSGHGLWIDVEANSIRVLEDAAGTSEYKDVYHAVLTPAQTKSLAQCILSMPVGQLKDRYVPENQSWIQDGFSMTFRIPDGPNSLRLIGVGNFYQKDLMKLSSCVDQLLPDKFRIRYEEPKQP